MQGVRQGKLEKFLRAQWRWLTTVLAMLLMAYYFILPSVLFSDPYSTVLEDRQGNLLSASIAKDGQWRFPPSPEVPDKFKQALLLFEDKRFYTHTGVDIRSMARALRQNIQAGKVVSGGSTLSMQLIRLSLKNKTRNLWQKIVEMVMATRLEWSYSKNEILSMYTSHAPFGGNVVGLEAACWRYYGRTSQELSWAEAATLAVLPNNPGMINLARNRPLLKEKRNRLLKRLAAVGHFDSLALSLALQEDIPGAPLLLPRHATHLLDFATRSGHRQQRIVSTLQTDIQVRAEQVLWQHYERLKSNQIHNAAALILEVATGNVLGYVGNVPSGPDHQEQVDVIQAPRSTGSILKPFLFAAMMDEGKLTPGMLVADVPTMIQGFAPQNFSKTFDGAVPAREALIRSLNIPAVLELREYRYEKFHSLLKNLGLTTLTQPADHYGLTLITGGAEGTLWDITGAYASMARTLNRYFTYPGKRRYTPTDFHAPVYLLADSLQVVDLQENSFLSASSVYHTFETLKEVYRPGEETGWQHFETSKKIAWKTGTSFGFRDGWAVGVNGAYAIGVWVGNADGEGRPHLTGTEAAAPILFDLFSILPGQQWFHQPVADMQTFAICSHSGHPATNLCEKTDTLLLPRSTAFVSACSYHKRFFLTTDGKHRVHSNCESPEKMKAVSWFVLPPVQEYYFKSKSMSYQPVPPYRYDCENPTAISSMELIYPRPSASVFVPRLLDGTESSVVLQAAHRNSESRIYWHVDDTYVGSTYRTHKLSIHPSPGKHMLVLVDDSGESIQVNFTVIDRQ